MRRLRRILLGLCLCAGWFALLLATGAWVAERSGLLTALVRDSVAANLGALGDDLRLGGVRVSWFQGVLEAEAIEFGAGAEFARIEEVRIEFGLDVGFGAGTIAGLALRTDRVIVRKGRVTLSDALQNGIQQAQQRLEERGAFQGARQRIPDIEVENVVVEVDSRTLGRLPLGVVDAAVRENARGEPELEGRLVPSLARGTTDPGEIYLYGRSSEPGRFDVIARAERVPLGTQYLPDAPAYAALRGLEPRGFVDLRAKATFSLAGTTPPQLDVRLRVSDGSVLVAEGRQRIEGITLELEAGFARPTNEAALDPRSWSGALRLSGSLDGRPFDVTGILGPEAGRGLLAKAFGHVPRLPLVPSLLELVPGAAVARPAWDAVSPAGECEAWIAAEIPLAWSEPASLWKAITFGCHLQPKGGASLRFVGWPHGSPPVYDGGFPLLAEKVAGDIVCVRSPERLQPLLIGLVNLRGMPPRGDPLVVNGWVGDHARDVPIYLPCYGLAELDLRIRGGGIPVDQHVFDALHGLARSVEPAAWQEYGPHGGLLDVDLRLARTVDMRWISVDLELGMRDTNLLWRELPVPMSKVDGKFELLSDGQREIGLAFRFDGELDTAQKLSVRGRFQTDPGYTPAEGGKNLLEITSAEVDIQGLSLKGADATALIDYLAIKPSVEMAAPKGYCDVHMERARTSATSPVLYAAEIRPLERAEMTPAYFNMITKGLRGRVLVTGVDREFEARIQPIVGLWGDDVVIAATGGFPGGAIEIFGAGLDPESKSLLGALAIAIRGTSGSGATFDTQALSVSGAIDLAGRLDLGAEDGAKVKSSFRFHLRGDSLQTAGGFRLDGLQGVLDLDEEGVLVGTDMSARLAGTPLFVSRATFHPEKDVRTLEVAFSTRGLPIDREHLQGFVDQKTLDALLGELGWKGLLDVRDGRITVKNSDEGPSLVFSGSITPSEMSIRLGLPLSVKTAEARVENLRLDKGPVRAQVSIEKLEGSIAGRSFGPASVLLTYVEPKFSIEDLTGALEGGEILPLGVGSTRHGTAFSLDLEPPYSFQLAIELKQVEVRGFLRGMLPSEFATRGRADAKLLLTGDLERMLAVKGSGSVLVTDSRLWSIPVFRALLTQLGFDDTAVFESMAMNLKIADGRIRMEDIVMTSPLTLDLAGAGTLDFDSTLDYEFDVHYGLVDNLGPITLLFYSIQNELLRVQLRGDLARPKFVFKNLFTNLFGGGKLKYRSLPTPSFSDLPPRF